MKQLVTIAAGLLLSIGSFAQMSEIRGTMKETLRKDINLYGVEDGELKLMATTQLGEDGSFGFLFTPSEEGFYALGYQDRRPSSAQYPVYLKKGDKAEVVIDQKRIQYVGKQTPENAVLSSWNQLTEDIKIKALYFIDTPISTYKDFFPLFTQVAAKTDAFRNKINTKNTRFNELMKAVTYFDMDLYATYFIHTPRKEHPKPEDLIPYYKTISYKDRLVNDDILSTIYGKNLLLNYGDLAKAGKGESVDQILPRLTTDRQRGVFAFARATPFVQNYTQYEGMVDKYNKYFQSSESLKAKVKDLGLKLYSSKPGGKGVNFSFPDKDGKMVSFSDLKGKLVLIDVWATWCKPCVAEIPYLKQLEEEFKDQDIAFVSLSTDEKKNEQTWQNMIKARQMGGIQLFAGGSANIVSDMYEIETIPRFMLFDREGKIIDLRAPRPSDPKLKAMILAELNKKNPA